MTPLDHGRDLPTVRGRYSKAVAFVWADDTGERCAEWRVLPIALPRDSQPIDESNFEAAQLMLDDAGAVYKVFRFSHWAIGWYEAIVVAPDDVSLAAAGEIVCALDIYPVLDEYDLGGRESEDQLRAWQDWGADEYVRGLPLDHDASRDLVLDYVRAIGPHDVPGMRYVEQLSDGPSFSYDTLDRHETARLLCAAREWRKVGV
jgi:hypothetical protein